MEATKQEKIAIALGELHNLSQIQYQLELRVRIARKVGNDAGEKQGTEELTRVLAAVDFVEQEIKELEKE